jgi:hypothetical protein
MLAYQLGKEIYRKTTGAILVNLEDFDVPRNAAVYNLGLISNSSHSALSEDSDKR